MICVMAWLDNTSNVQVNNACNVAPDCSKLLETSKLKKLIILEAMKNKKIPQKKSAKKIKQDRLNFF